MSGPLLSVKDLVVEFARRGSGRGKFRALDGVSLDVAQGETVGLVGESGSGKTTLGRAILGLTPITSGTITLNGRDTQARSARERKSIVKDVQVVFQDPYTSLNPAMTIESILTEPLHVFGISGSLARDRIRGLLDRVGLPSDAGRRYPREFSGGQRQRIAIARALALEPRLIVCDEPVSALDLSTQARILDLFVDIQEQTGVGYLFISHDLTVIRHISHRVCVLYRGRIVEAGDCAQVTTEPQHPYTRKLLMAAPVPDPDLQAERRRLRAELQAENFELPS